MLERVLDRLLLVPAEALQEVALADAYVRHYSPRIVHGNQASWFSRDYSTQLGPPLSGLYADGSRLDTCGRVRNDARRRAPPKRKRGTMVGHMLSGVVAVLILVTVLALVYRLATGDSPWPVFVLAELPGAGFGFIMLSLTAPRS